MSEDVLSPLTAGAIRIRDRKELEEFLMRPDADGIVRACSFEQIFFTIKALGLADSIDLLAHVTPNQVAGFFDLDCWRKDSFVPRPFIEWIAALAQLSPEATVRALAGADEYVVALFLKDLIEVYEIERDEPPPESGLMFSPDNRFAVRQTGAGDAAAMAYLILDACFRYDPALGYSLLRRVRYATRTELEETAYQHKVRRLDVHGFVDYYEALSIYAGPEARETAASPRAGSAEETVPGEDPPQSLPTVFADSLSDGGFLLSVFARVSPAETGRMAQELTALGNRILSANLIDLGEVGGIRSALREMRDLVTIGLESLAGTDIEAAAGILESSHVQTVFKAGFDQLARLRDLAERVKRLPGFRLGLLESPDQEFMSGLLRFKPFLWDEGRYRDFERLADVERARRRMEDLRTMAEGFLELFGPCEMSLRKAFGTALVRKATSGEFRPVPVTAKSLERFLASGMAFPEIELPVGLEPFARGWSAELRTELESLAGKPIDARFVSGLRVA